MQNVVAREAVVLLVAVGCFCLHARPALALSPTPNEGEVFREYTWIPEAGHFHVLNYKQSPVKVEGNVDLAFATRAELVIEIANAHLGFPDLAVQVNGNSAWHPIEFPAQGPKEPSPAFWFHHWYPTLPVALSELHTNGANELLFRIGDLLPGKWVHPPWTPIYGATLRVFYDAAKKPHPTGRITSPVSRARLGDAVALAAEASSPNGGIKRIEFIGRYEGLNPEGDGLWDQWHYTIEKGETRRHLGTVGPTERGTWDTTWLPEQRQPMQVAARIVDATGLIVTTPPVGELSLLRSAYRVELVKPTEVPCAFTNCQYGLFIYQGPREEKLIVSGDVAHLVDARVAFSGWNAPAWRRFSVNGSLIDEVFTPHGEADGNRALMNYSLRPLALVKHGENTLATVPGPARQMDVHWPGVALLLKYAAAPATKVEPAKLALTSNKLGMSFVTVSPGTFTMGSAEAAPGHMWEERQHLVQLTKPFRIGTTEVTQSQFEAVMGRNPSHVQMADFPATQVTWDEAVEFCKRLSKREGRKYRLPTEAEWEYAARAGSNADFVTGESVAFWQANHDPRRVQTDEGYRGGPSRVGTFAANDWGLADVAGNVWEWVADWYGEYPKAGAPLKDPVGVKEAASLEYNHVLRGGAWDSPPNMLRPGFRWRAFADTRLPSIGFRVVLEGK